MVTLPPRISLINIGLFANASDSAAILIPSSTNLDNADKLVPLIPPLNRPTTIFKICVCCALVMAMRIPQIMMIIWRQMIRSPAKWELLYPRLLLHAIFMPYSQQVVYYAYVLLRSGRNI